MSIWIKKLKAEKLKKMKRIEKQNSMREAKAGKIFLMLAALLFIIMLTQNALALGITPGRVTLKFEPGLHQEIAFKVVNNEHKDMRVMFSIAGELANYITLNIPSLTVSFKADEAEKNLAYAVDLPEKMISGEHEVKIIATELAPVGAEEGVQVGATVAVASQLLVKVPYPYRYARLRLTVSESDVNETTSFYVEVENLGRLNLEDMQAKIEIFSATDKKIAELNTDAKTIASETKAELVAKWTANANPGNYLAIASLEYDANKTAAAQAKFAVGTLIVDVIDISVESFHLGDIAKFDITLQNKWSENVSNVYATLQMQNESNYLIADVKTPSVELLPLSINVLNAYWDTAGVQEGTYDGKIIINYADRVLERKLKSRLTLNSIKVDILGVGITAKVTAAEAGKRNLMLVIVILLVLTNIAWFAYFKRRERKRQNKKI